MATKNYNVIGVMSGTSLDGIDIALLTITSSPTFGYKIQKAKTVAYPDHWVQKLKKAVDYTSEILKSLNEKYTDFLAETINTFIKDHNIEREHLSAICSHGHTILHKPDQGITLQIGNLPKIATLTQCKVVCDFRVQDVALGGQGAPLVPIGDQLLFPAYGYCINLGGFANISFQNKHKRIAYDICPVNIVLNTYAQRLEKPYDEFGNLAKAGKVNEVIFNELNALSFYDQDAPKSLGLEWVQEYIFPILEKSQLSTIDVLATFTEHIAYQIASQCESGSSVLITGGGAYNHFLLERIRFRESVRITVPDPELLEFKEALIFGLLGVLRLEHKANTLASVTGALYDHSAGEIYLP